MAGKEYHGRWHDGDLSVIVSSSPGTRHFDSLPAGMKRSLRRSFQWGTF